MSKGFFILRFSPQFYQHCNGCDVDNSKPVGCCMVTALSILVSQNSWSSHVHCLMLLFRGGVGEKCELHENKKTVGLLCFNG